MNVLGDVISSAVYAVNGAGLSSTIISSDGYIVDNTPPTDEHYFNFEDSIIQNDNFTTDTNHWEVDADQVTISKNKLCLLNGVMKQTVSTGDGQKYRLQFDAVSGFATGHTSSIGYVRFGPKEHHIISAADVDDALHLQEKVYFLMAHDANSELTFGSMTDMRICFGNIQLVPMKEGHRNIDSASDPEALFTSSIHVHVRASSMGTSLIVNWEFEDPETPIVEYMFAVGTVKGQCLQYILNSVKLDHIWLITFCESDGL